MNKKIIIENILDTLKNDPDFKNLILNVAKKKYSNYFSDANGKGLSIDSVEGNKKIEALKQELMNDVYIQLKKQIEQDPEIAKKLSELSKIQGLRAKTTKAPISTPPNYVPNSAKREVIPTIPGQKRNN